MTRSVALSRSLHAAAVNHLVRRDGQEDICFALYHPSTGTHRDTVLVYELLLPEEGDRDVHGNVAFNPQFFRRALSAAIASSAGLLLMHSHPGGGWQGMSDDDIDAEQGNAGAVLAATGFPLAGLTLAVSDLTWSARVWRRSAPRIYAREDCESVRVVGEGLAVSWNPALRPAPRARAELLRTTEAWGSRAHADLVRLRIGIVGLGSVGSVISEALARLGIQRVLLLDFDRIERHNLDRVLHATAQDVATRTPKVDVASRAAEVAATSADFEVTASQSSVCEEAGYRAVLDCDVLFSCVDRPWPRSVLNYIAYAHLIPVIDGGIAISRTSTGRMRSAEWRAHTAAPGAQCLACMGQYEPGLVETERSGLLDDPSYIEQLDKDHPLRSNQNVFTFSLAAASLELLQLVLLAIGPGGVTAVGRYEFRFPSSELALRNEECFEGCPNQAAVGLGEFGVSPGTGVHLAAQRARQSI